MLKIKLARFGKKNQPHYRIVVNEARDKRDGKYVALLGHYASTSKPKELLIDVKAYDEWVKKGAQATETVAALYKRFKSGNSFPEKKASLSKKAKAKLNAEKVAPEVAVAEVAPELKKVTPETATVEVTPEVEKTLTEETKKPVEAAVKQESASEKVVKNTEV